jgi:hypothetical protein
LGASLSASVLVSGDSIMTEHRISDIEGKKNNAGSSSDFESLRKMVLANILEQAIRDGEIDILGKNNAEVEETLRDYADDFLSNLKDGNVELTTVLDLANPILEQAREFVKEGKLEFACVFYATWIEHWTNDLIDALSTRLGMGQEIGEQVIRETNLKGKLTWILRMFDMPEIDPAYLKSIINISDMRNSYIHYKFKPVDDWDERKETLQKAMEMAESIVEYLDKYRSEHLFEGTDKVIHQFVEKHLSQK